MKHLLLTLALLAPPAFAQVYTPRNIPLTVSFNNPLLGPLFGAPGGPALQRIYFSATTDPAPPGGARSATRQFDSAPPDTPRSMAAIVSVDDTAGGLSYRTQTIAQLGNGQQYYFAPQTLASSAPSWTVSDVAARVNIDFRNPDNSPLFAQGGTVVATTLPSLEPQGYINIAPGSSSIALLGRGGARVRFDVYLDLGFGGPSGTTYRQKFTVNDWAAAALPGDTMQFASITVPFSNTPGSVSGYFDLTDESVSYFAPQSTPDGFFELPVPTPVPNDDRPDYPVMRVVFTSGDGYGNWERHHSFFGGPGSEASGFFNNGNLLTTPVPGGGYYRMYGETFVRRGPAAPYSLEYLRTPSLGGGSNPSLQINPALNASTDFVLHPGFLKGSLTLSGPPVLAGQPALLAHLRRFTDGDTNGDGIPETPASEWFYGSQIIAAGVDELAPGATLTAAEGYAFVPVTGGFNPGSGVLSGTYDIALGGLRGEDSYWQSKDIALSMANPGATAESYFATSYYLTDARPVSVLKRLVSKGTDTTFNIQRGFGEVCLTIRAENGSTLYSPSILSVTPDPDFPANEVSLVNFAAYGFPTVQAGALPVASIRTLLPAGHWILHPRINPGDQPPGTDVELLPVKVSVATGGRICGEVGFLMQADIPSCLAGPAASISGSVASGLPVTLITYSLDGGPPITLCTNCGVNPAFSINVSALADGLHRIVITATGPGGQTASINQTFLRDSVPLTMEPAVIIRWGCGILQCSTDNQNWTDVPGAVSPFASPTTAPRKFWKVRQP